MLILGVILLIVFIIIAVLITSLTRTQQTDDPDAPPSSNTPTASQVTLTYHNLWEPSSVVQPLIDQYERENQHVKINYVNKSITQYELNTYTRLSQGATTNEPVPDIVKINGTWLPKFEQYLSPIPTSVMSSSEYTSTFYPAASEAFTGSDNQLYAIPHSIDGLVLFYNKNLLAEQGMTEPPADWNSFLEASKKLTKRDAQGRITQAGVGMGSATNIKHSADILNLLFLQNQAKIVSSDGESIELSDAKAVQAVTYYTDYVKTHNVWSPDFQYDLDEFYAGKVAMFFGPSWRAFDIINASPQLEFGMTEVPQLPNNPKKNYAMFWGDAVPSKSQNQLEAWKFIRWMSEAEQMRAHYENGSNIRAFGQIYSRPDIAEEISSNPYVKPVVDSAPTMSLWQMGDQQYMEDELNKAITAVSQRGTAPSSALEQAVSSMNSKYASY